MFLASLLFGISASLDSLLVGISYGIRGTRIRFWQNLTISLITLLGTCLSVGLGHRLAPHLPGFLSSYVGSIILTLLGLYYIIKWAITHFRGARQDHPPTAGEEAETAPDKAKEPDTPLKLSEVFTLSLTLSLNNLSAGLSASLAGLTLLPAAVSTLACSVLFLFSGNRLGQNPILQFTGRAADPLSGVLLIGLGLIQLFLP